jgi:hypothetical protein
MRRTFAVGIAVLITACGVGGGSGDDLSRTTSTISTTNPDQPVDSGGDEPIVEPGPPGSIPEPRPPIDGNVNGEVFITSADLRIMESFPIQVALDVSGDKPTPCHEIFWTVEDDGEVIAIDMISQVAQDQVCTQVLEPFSIVVPLGSWAEASREVTLNGEIVGSFES